MENSLSLAAIEAELKPKVMEAFDKIAGEYKRLRRLQDQDIQFRLHNQSLTPAQEARIRAVPKKTRTSWPGSPSKAGKRREFRTPDPARPTGRISPRTRKAPGFPAESRGGSTAEARACRRIRLGEPRNVGIERGLDRLER